MRTLIRRSKALAAAVAVLFLAASPAQASYETFKRALSNMLFSPVDIVLSPVVAARSVAVNMRDIDDSTGVRIAYAVPGWAWNVGIQGGGGIIRMIAGALEMVPGLILLPFPNTDMDPIFAPAERGEAMVDLDTPPIFVKLGVNYTTIPY